MNVSGLVVNEVIIFDDDIVCLLLDEVNGRDVVVAI